MTVPADMSQCQYPTLDRLGIKLPADIDAPAVMKQWFDGFARSFEARDAQDVFDLLLPDAFWRDILSLTWDFRTFYSSSIITFLNDRLPGVRISNVSLDASSVTLLQPFPDVAYIHAFFKFETTVGLCSGIARIVPTSSGAWKASTIFTNLEDLRGHLEMVGPCREQAPSHGQWLEKRRREIACEDEDEQPAVVIIGAGQAGLEAAARLKYLGVKSLILEKEARVGHLWRSRYEALCLHDTVWYDHMPYKPFPTTWPVYAPAPKLAEWLGHYAFDLELNVWTSAQLIKCKQDPKTFKWTLDVRRSDGSIRKLVVNHVIGAIGMGGGKMRIPEIPGMDNYQGKTLHSGRFTSGRDFIGKKVVVVGACSSAHDICRDLYDHGVDVTMFQRSSTYVMSVKNGVATILSAYNENSDPDVADRISASYPMLANKEILQRTTAFIAEADKEILDGLKRVGFRTNTGEEDTGFFFTAFRHAGGYYLDVGASQLIADGKIKLKSDSQIACFTKTGLEFENGSTLEVDAVVFATGYGDARETYREILGDDVGDKLKPIFGMDDEGEMRGMYRDTGVPRLWCMMGNLALCRFHSKHIALQIKAVEEGLWDGERYDRKA